MYNIKYCDKIWVDSYKLVEDLDGKEGEWLGVSEWLFIAVSEGAIRCPEV